MLPRGSRAARRPRRAARPELREQRYAASVKPPLSRDQTAFAQMRHAHGTRRAVRRPSNRVRLRGRFRTGQGIRTIPPGRIRQPGKCQFPENLADCRERSPERARSKRSGLPALRRARASLTPSPNAWYKLEIYATGSDPQGSARAGKTADLARRRLRGIGNLRILGTGYLRAPRNNLRGLLHTAPALLPRRQLQPDKKP